MNCQKQHFALESGVHYLNGAAYSPSLLRSIAAGEAGLQLKGRTPFALTPAHHFDAGNRTRQLFSDLIRAGDPERIALIPAVSYGLAAVALNLHRLPGIHKKKHILLIGEEFPNNVYAFERCCAALGLSIRTIARPASNDERGAEWNRQLQEAVDDETALVVAPHVHWIYGTVFDLVALGERCRAAGALLAIDATQSLGIMPFDAGAVRPDAVICAGYKWLLGPYGIGAAYFGSFFDEGVPVEESWMNRMESEQFGGLTRYIREYRPKAQRYNAGEYSQFIQLPMLATALEQLLGWGTDAMQDYCGQLTATAIRHWEAMGCTLETPAYRAAHLFGLSLPGHADSTRLLARLAERRVYASLRGGALRISVNVYNEAADLEALTTALEAGLM